MVEVYALGREVSQQVGVHAFDYLLDADEGFLDARPRTGVVVQDAVQDLAEAVVGIPLDVGQLLVSDLLQFGGLVERVEVDLDVLRQEHDDEGRGDIVDALHVPARRMPHVPHVQQPKYHPSYRLIIFWMRSLRKRLLSGSVRSTSSLMSLKIFFSCASCSRLGFSM